MGLLTITKTEVVVEQIKLKSARPFIYRSIYTNFLQDCLKKNPSAKNIDNILEKEIMFLINEFYENVKKSGEELRSKPLLKIKIRSTDSCMIETADIEEKLKKGLAVAHK